MGDQNTTNTDATTNTTPTQDNGGTQQPTSQQPPNQTGTAPDNSGENNPAWLPGRLERAEQKGVNDFLKSLGVEKPEDLKAKLDKLTSFEEQNQTEVERAQSALEQERQAREAAEQKLADALSQQRETAINSAITNAATSLRAKHPEDVVLWARSSGQDLDALLTDDGAADGDKVKALVEDAKKARPDWFRGDGPGSPSNADGKAPEPDAKARKAAQAQQHVRTRSAFN